MTCSHEFTEFGRVVYAGGYHVLERCAACHARVREGWVPHSEFDDPDSLPVFADRRPPEGRGEQRLLF